MALPSPHEAVIVRYEDGKERKITIAYNTLPVKLPKHAYSLFLAVAKGFGKEPMMLLPSCPVRTKTKEPIWEII